MKSHKILIMSSIEYGSFYLCRFNLAPVLPVLMDYFKVTHGEAGALASAIFLSYAVALVPAGVLGDKFGPKKIVALGAFISALSNISFPYVLTFSRALVVQFFNGFGQGMAWGPLTRLMSNWYPKEKIGFIMSLLSIPPSVGPVLAYIAAGYFTTAYGWKTAFWYPSFALLILTFFFWVLVRDRPLEVPETREGSSTKGRILSVVSNRDVWLAALAYLCLYTCSRGMFIWLPTYLTETARLSLFLAALLGGVVTLSGIGTMLFGAWLADVKLKGRKKVVIASAFVFAVPTMVVMPYLTDLNWVLLTFSLAFAFLNFGASLYFAYPSLLLPVEAVGTAAGLIDTLGYVGNFLGTLLIGLIFDFFHSYDPAFLVLAAIAMIGSAVASQLRK